MNPSWYPGYYLDPKHWPEWMPEVFPHWLPASLVRTPPEIPPESWPEPSAKPSYGLFDELPERLRPKSFEEQLAALPTLLPVPETPAPQPNSSLWGGLLPVGLASQPAQWPDTSPVSMPPSAPTAESLPPLWPRWPHLVSTLGGGPPAKIAGWPDDVPMLPVQWPSSAQFPAMPPAPPTESNRYGSTAPTAAAPPPLITDDAARRADYWANLKDIGKGLLFGGPNATTHTPIDTFTQPHAIGTPQMPRSDYDPAPVPHLESSNYWGAPPNALPKPIDDDPFVRAAARVRDAVISNARRVQGTALPSWLPEGGWTPVLRPPVTPSSALQGALTPFTSYPETYEQMRHEALDLISEGFGQAKRAASTRQPTVGQPLARPSSSKGDEFLLGLGKTALGSAGYALSPLDAAVRTVVSKPIEAAFEIPKEYTELAASLWPPKLAIPIGMSAVKFFPHHKVKAAEAMEAAGRDWKDIVRETGLYRGAEGKWRFELSDKGYRIRPSAGTLDKDGYRVSTLFEHYDHPGLREAYPHLAAVTSRLRIDPNRPYFAAFDPSTNTLAISATSVTEARTKGIHELVHPIQDYEKHARGGSPEGLRLANPSLSRRQSEDDYRKLAGEVEARAAEARLRMNARARRRTPFRETEEKIVPRDEQIIKD